MKGTWLYQEWQKEHWGICAQEHVFFMRDGFSGLPLYAPMTANMNEAESPGLSLWTWKICCAALGRPKVEVL